MRPIQVASQRLFYSCTGLLLVERRLPFTRELRTLKDVGEKRASAVETVHQFHKYFRDLPSAIGDKLLLLGLKVVNKPADSVSAMF